MILLQENPGHSVDREELLMFMRTALVVGLLAGGAGLALADSKTDKVAAVGSLSTDQVTTRLQSQGLTVSKIKLDDGQYKVKAVDASGHKQKFNVNPQTGAVVSKSDDDGSD
jgi:flagellar hook assembly protein FlgD